MPLHKIIFCMLSFQVFAQGTGINHLLPHHLFIPTDPKKTLETIFPNRAYLPRTHQEHDQRMQEHLKEEDSRPEAISLSETLITSIRSFNPLNYGSDLFERVFPEGKPPVHISKPKTTQAPGSSSTGSGASNGGGGGNDPGGSSNTNAESSNRDPSNAEQDREIDVIILQLKEIIITCLSEQFSRTYDILSPEIKTKIKERDNGFLRLSATLGSIETFHLLVQKGFNINQLSEGSSTPVSPEDLGANRDSNYQASPAHYAIINNKSDIFYYLLAQENFDPTLQDSKGQSILKIMYDLKKINFLRILVRSQYIETIVKNPNDDSLKIPIKNIFVFKDAILNNASIPNPENWQNTVASWILLGEYDGIRQFIDRYPNMLTLQLTDYFLIHRLVQGFDMEKKHQLAEEEHLITLLKCALRLNPNIANQVNKNNETPLDLAIQNGHSEVVSLLVTLGNVPLETVQNYLKNKNLSLPIRESLRVALSLKKFFEPTESQARAQLEHEQSAAFNGLVTLRQNEIQSRNRLKQEHLDKQGLERQNLEKQEELSLQEFLRKEGQDWHALQESHLKAWNEILRPIKAKEKEAALLAQAQETERRKKEKEVREQIKQGFLEKKQQLETEESELRNGIDKLFNQTFSTLSQEFAAKRLELESAQKEAQKRVQEQKRIQAKEANLHDVLAQVQQIPEIAGCPPLYAAVFLNNTRAIAYLLNQPTTDPMFRFQGYTPLSLAIHSEDVDLTTLRALINTQHIFRLLQEPCALEENHNYPAIFYAVKHKKLAKLKILLEAMDAQEVQPDSVLLNRQNLLDFTKSLFGEKPKKGSDEHRILKMVQEWFNQNKPS